MSPVVNQLIDGVTSRLRNPVLLFLIIINITYLGFVFYAVNDRRAKDHALIQAMFKECTTIMERGPHPRPPG